MFTKHLRVYQKAFTFRKLFNLVKVYSAYILSLLFRKPIVWGYPPIVMLEPTNICNLRCPLCPSGADQLTRERGFMALQQFKEIIDYIAPYTFKLIFWNQGEPFLHSSFCEMVRYASQKKIYVMVSTNANIMPPAEELVKSGLDELIVSLDGATQETYSKYRQSGSLDALLSNIQQLVSAKRQLKSHTPYIIGQFLVMRHNEHEFDTVKQLVKDTGMDMFSVKTVQIFSKEDIDEYLPQNPKYSRYKTPSRSGDVPIATTPPNLLGGENSSLLTPHSSLKNKCYRLWFQPVINWDGTVAVCCYDKDNVHKIGNIADTPFYALWHSERFKNFRQIVLKDRTKIDICCGCGEGTTLYLTQ